MSLISGFAKSFVRSANESAPYEVVQTFDNGIEERIYPGQKWAVTESIVETGQHDAKTRDMFFALFGYISGKNEKSQKIAMTIPVSTKVEPATNTCQMGFYVPQEFQNDTPQPSDPRVKIIERDLRVYTISFGGYRTEDIEQQKLKELLKFVKGNGLSVATLQDENMKPIYYFVGYDAPHKFWDRKNEIWVVAA